MRDPLNLEVIHAELNGLRMARITQSAGLKAMALNNAAVAAKMAMIVCGKWSPSKIPLSDLTPMMRASFVGDWGEEPVVEQSKVDPNYLRITIKRRQFLVETEITANKVSYIYKEWEGTTDDD